MARALHVRTRLSLRTHARLSLVHVQSLLNDEDSAVHALEELPVGLFPTLSTAAFDGGHTKTVTAMMQAWPFPCLHLGSLRDQSITQDLLEAVLDGLELVPTNAACPRRSKPKVLDFTHDFEHSNWEECSETTPAPFVVTHMLEEPEADPRVPSSREQPPHHREPMEIHTDLFLGGLFGLFHLSGLPLVHPAESREEPRLSASLLSDPGRQPGAVPQPCRDPGSAGAGDHPRGAASSQG
ncbi:melanoma antigen preferentially expressed in tumors isoform X3 [Ailuropoda melanoleuca]|uniref:melanoma antigen preferentially expressed in tumors isoform X3 n=1 Tax=Ailuropoda melanoleuca TaxID=9646 RepID=UPI0014941CC2|nr:melanoma antigen preferentially expressed in tumors isoform X3 [Ailuropoda melanoleuca]